MKRKPKPKLLSRVHEAFRPYLSEKAGSKRRSVAVHRDNAARAKHLQYREVIAALHYQEKKSITYIAKTLRISRKMVQRYLDWSLERVLAMSDEERTVTISRKAKRKKPGPRPVIAGTVVKARSRATTVDPKLIKQVFYMYTNAVPVDDIAELLDLSVMETNAILIDKLQALNASELNTTELARRRQLEQIDQALRAIMPFVSGLDIQGEDHPLDKEYMDKFIRLMDQKAKLQGLNAPVKVNLTSRMEVIAKLTDLSIEDVQELMLEVMESYAELGSGQ